MFSKRIQKYYYFKFNDIRDHLTICYAIVVYELSLERLRLEEKEKTGMWRKVVCFFKGNSSINARRMLSTLKTSILWRFLNETKAITTTTICVKNNQHRRRLNTTTRIFSDRVNSSVFYSIKTTFFQSKRLNW